MPWNKIQRAVELFKSGSLRSALDQLWGSLSLDGLSAKTPATSRVAFTIAVVTLAAKMSKADGVSTKVEAEAFERLFKVSADQLGHVRRVFQMGSQDIAGYEVYATQIANLLEGEPELKRTVLECLFHVASADGILIRAKISFSPTWRVYLVSRMRNTGACGAPSSSIQTAPMKFWGCRRMRACKS